VAVFLFFGPVAVLIQAVTFADTLREVVVKLSSSTKAWCK